MSENNIAMLACTACAILVGGVGMAVSMRRMGSIGAPARVSAVAWRLPAAALLVFVLCWALAGRLEAGLGAYALFCAGCAAAMLVPCLRGRVATVLGELGLRYRAFARAALVLGVAVLSFLALEVPSNPQIWFMNPIGVGIEILIIALAGGALYLVGCRRGVGPALVALVCAGFGIAEYFVMLYKGQPITPGDVLAAGTAAAVSGGYDYLLSPTCLAGLVFCALAIGAASLTGVRAIGPLVSAEPLSEDAKPLGAHARPRSEKGSWAGPVRRSRAAVAVGSVVGGVLLAVLLGLALVYVPLSAIGVSLSGWELPQSYRSYGFITSFVANVQLIWPHEPSGYSDDEADELVAAYARRYDEGAGASEARAAAEAQFAEEQPSIVVVMNETFSDLSIYDGLDAGYEGLDFFPTIDDALMRGSLYVSAYGGGTANSEFEFLTGLSMGFVGNGVYPFQSYDLSNAPSLARELADAGYTTCAMHPNLGTNWNREHAYASLGFDEFLTIDDFDGADTLRGLVSDAATYDVILDRLENDDSPQFIFDVTMQNHSGYLTGELPEDVARTYVDYDLVDEESGPETNEYLSLIDESERALEEFMDALRELDRPVVLVFFGDHQPFFASEYNDALMDDDDELEHAMRIYRTDYVVWANYNVAGAEQASDDVTLSTNYLGALVLESIGAPLSDFEKTLLAVREELPVVTMAAYADEKRVWHEHGADAPQAYGDLREMQYRMLFRPLGDDSQVLAVEGQDAANPDELI